MAIIIIFAGDQLTLHLSPAYRAKVSIIVTAPVKITRDGIDARKSACRAKKK